MFRLKMYNIFVFRIILHAILKLVLPLYSNVCLAIIIKAAKVVLWFFCCKRFYWVFWGFILLHYKRTWFWMFVCPFTLILKSLLCISTLINHYFSVNFSATSGHIVESWSFLELTGLHPQPLLCMRFFGVFDKCHTKTVHSLVSTTYWIC